MTGTWFNVLALLSGGLCGLLTRKEPAEETQRALKVLLGVFIVWTGLKLSWASLNGTFSQVLGQLGITILALSLGHATGGLLRLQSGLNHLGSYARRVLTPTSGVPSAKPGDVFLACVVVFALNPLGTYGALLEGALGSWEVLAIKAIMDGLSGLAFARALGWPVLLSIIPVLAVQGTLTQAARVLTDRVLTQPMIDSIGAAGGMLVFSVCLVVFPVKKIRLADYLPAFLYAPLLAWWLR